MIEVILFTALSGLFLIIAFVGLGGRTQNVQFTDSIRSMEAFMQQQISNVRNGVNLTGDGDEGAQIVLGTILHFNVGSENVDVYKIRGARLTNPQGSARDLIYDSVNGLSGSDIVYEQGSYQLEWGVAFRDPAINGSSANYVGFLRNPNGTDIVTVVWDLPPATDPLGALNNAQTYQPGSAGYIVPAIGDYCFQSTSGKVADIRVGGGSRLLEIEPTFEPGSGACSTI